MNYLEYYQTDLVNGRGIRVSLFVSGCEHHCKDCFSKTSWNKDNGKKFDSNIKNQIFDRLSKPFISGISILGGDPLAPYNRKEVLKLCEEIKINFPTKTVYIWTGYDFEYIKENCEEFLNVSDLIITDLFDKNLSLEAGIPKEELYLRGSRNQQYIINKTVYNDLPKELKEIF